MTTVDDPHQTADSVPPAGLGVLLAQMQALLQVLPGTAAPVTPSCARIAQTDAEVEAGFDNMPV